jgi:hypothetical protein
MCRWTQVSRVTVQPGGGKGVYLWLYFLLCLVQRARLTGLDVVI